MHASITTSMSAFWVPIALLVSFVCGFPSSDPRSTPKGFSLNTIPNPKFSANGTAAKLKAIAKYSHLAGSTVDDKYSGPCKSILNYLNANLAR